MTLTCCPKSKSVSESNGFEHSVFIWFLLCGSQAIALGRREVTSNSPHRLSVLLPAFNGMPFVLAVVQEIQRFLDSRDELVVSTGWSTDGTADHLARASSQNTRIIAPPSRPMSMAEHWDWLSTQASGTWQMFLGQDDCLQAYYSREIDRLIDLAQKRCVRVIVAKRAFLHWPSQTAAAKVEFEPRRRLKLRSLKLDEMLAESGLRSYHSMPQMYTSTIVRSSLVEEIRSRQNGNLIVAHPQDASLAASIASVESHYLWSGIPFAWVGTSSKSAGLAVARRASSSISPEKDSADLAKAYARSVAESPLRYPDWAGSFSLAENTIYYWQARLLVRKALGLKTSRVRFKLGLAAAIWGSFLRLPPNRKSVVRKIRALEKVASANRLPRWVTTRFLAVAGIFAHQFVVVQRLALAFIRKHRAGVFGELRASHSLRFELVPAEHFDLTFVNQTARKRFLEQFSPH